MPPGLRLRRLGHGLHLPATTVVGQSIFEIFPELVGTPRAAALERALAGEVVVFSHRFHEYFLPVTAPAGFPEVTRMQQSTRIAPRIDFVFWR